jgi:hypothetical protein
VRTWQNRPLEPIYGVVYLGCVVLDFEFVRKITLPDTGDPCGTELVPKLPVSRRTHMDSDRPIRILIMDDNGVDRALYRQCLEMSPAPGFEFAESDFAVDGIERSKALATRLRLAG